MRSRNSVTRIRSLVAIVAVMFTVSAVTTSSQPAGETYYGCLAFNRFLWVNTSSNLPCAAPGRVISWNELGQPGLPGPAGEIGPQGEQGEPGQAGPQGETGQQGETGPQGEPGTSGSVTLAGVVLSDGSPVDPSGFTTRKIRVGLYEVIPDQDVFSGTRSLIPVVSASPEAAGRTELISIIRGSRSFQVLFTEDTNFTFIVSEARGGATATK